MQFHVSYILYSFAHNPAYGYTYAVANVRKICVIKIRVGKYGQNGASIRKVLLYLHLQ